ncbi:unnamed protein product, partial [marine sediment metagenome]
MLLILLAGLSIGPVHARKLYWERVDVDIKVTPEG